MAERMQLPIRLVPRRGTQVAQLLFAVAFFGFAVFWTASAADFFDADFKWADLKTNWFPLFGLPFLAVGLSMMVNAALSLLPNSPYFHLQVGADGIVTRAFYKSRFYAWRELPPFEILEVVKRDEDGKRLLHYAAAMKDEAPLAQARADGTYRREIVRLDADDYGRQKGEAGAAALADWLNRLRELALDGKLRAADSIPVPEEFRAAAREVSAAPSSGTPQRSQTVIRR